MDSSGWQAQEQKLLASQAPVSIPQSNGPTSGSAIPSTSSDSVSVSAAGVITAESKQESSPGKLLPPPGYEAPSTLFTYGVPPNANMAPAYSPQSSSTPVMIPSVASFSPRHQVPSLSSSHGPSFSYNNSNGGFGFSNNQQLQSSMNISAGHFQGPGPVLSTKLCDPFVPVATVSAFSALPAVRLIPGVSSFSVPASASDTSRALGPPGTGGESLQSSSGPSAPSEVVGSSSAMVVRPVVPVNPASSNPAPTIPAVNQPIYPIYLPVPTIGVSPQPVWLQHPQMGGVLGPSYLPYPSTYPVPLHLGVRGSALPSVPLPASQPPGVTPIGNLVGTLISTNISCKQLGPEVGEDLPAPGTDGNNDVTDAVSEDTSMAKKNHAWTAHRSETGALYYYNAMTGESTYEKPLAFQGEDDRVTAESTPVTWEKLLGSDWALVTTNDGKKYYFNTTTKVSSWQMPVEVTELRKESDDRKEHKTLGTNVGALSEKLSGSLSAPALNGDGRDSAALRTATGSSSALDLIKKKLQDAGTTVTASPIPAAEGLVLSETNGQRSSEATVKGMQSESSKDKPKEANVDANISDSSTDSEDIDGGATIEERIFQFKEMLKDRGVAPFSKWEKELPKIVFDPRFKSIPTYAERRTLFEHYVRTRADEERKEKRAAVKAAIEGFKALLEDAKEDIDHHTDYQSFKKKWDHDRRFEALDRKERELLLNERVLLLKKAAEDKARAARLAVASSFKLMLQEKGDITAATRWSRVKDSLRDDPRWKAVRHEDREILFNEYISELKTAYEEAEGSAKAKREEQDKLKERERELRKRKEREEHEMERIRLKVRRKEAVASYQALLVETIKHPQASWTESKPKLEKDPQRRAANPDLVESDMEKLFREHVKLIYERCVHDFKTLLAEVITAEAAAQETEEGKTVLTSWSTAKQHLKSDLRYSKIRRKEREALWQRHVDEMQRMRDVVSEEKSQKLGELKGRSLTDARGIHSALRTSCSRR